MLKKIPSKIKIKKLLSISFILLLASCNNPVKNIPRENPDTVSATEAPDTITKTSKPFRLNNILCYWKNYTSNEEETLFTLINSKTKEKLLDQTISVRDIGLDPQSGNYFEKLNEMVFKDINFDGFKDFVYLSIGSSEMTSMTNIFIFNKLSGQFEFSEDFSATNIETDTLGRKLITTGLGRDFEVTKTHYFDTSGKVKYTEVITQYSKYQDGTEFSVAYKIYEKIIDGIIVETKKDSIIDMGK